MTPEEIARREDEALALLASQPGYPAANVQTHEWLEANRIAKKLGASGAGTAKRMKVVLKCLAARAEAFLPLVTDLATQKAYVVALQQIHRTAWFELTNVPLEQVASLSPEMEHRLATLSGAIRHWENEGFKRLASPARNPQTNLTADRRGYRPEVKAWMSKTRAGSVREAAKRLAVSESTLKSIMSDKGRAKYGQRTLAEVLNKIGYKSK